MAVLMQQMLQTFQHCMNPEQQPQQGARQQRPRNRGRGRGRGRGRNSRNTRAGGPRTMTYCHTHGWCYHNGHECNYPGSDHKPEATIDNRMDGSTDGLPPGYL